MSSSQVVAAEVCFPYRISLRNTGEVEIHVIDNVSMNSRLCNMVLLKIVDSVNELFAETFKDKKVIDNKDVKDFFSSSFQNSYNLMLEKHPEFASMVNDLQQKSIRHIQLETVILP